MWDDELAYDKPFCRSLSEKSRFPVQVIHAGKGLLHTYGESWHSHCPQARDYFFIENAGHFFEQLDAVPHLLESCRDWFARF